MTSLASSPYISSSLALPFIVSTPSTAAHLVVVLVAVHRVEAALAPEEVVAGAAVHRVVAGERAGERDRDDVRVLVAGERALVAEDVVAARRRR